MDNDEQNSSGKMFQERCFRKDVSVKLVSKKAMYILSENTELIQNIFIINFHFKKSQIYENNRYV